MRKPRNTEMERAITLICKGVVEADVHVVRKMLCLVVGHPPAFKYVVNRYIANTTIPVCVRCGSDLPIIPDLQTLTQLGWENVGPNLWVKGKLTPTDILLTGLGVLTAKTKVAV
jgi:hypothetical protein